MTRQQPKKLWLIVCMALASALNWGGRPALAQSMIPSARNVPEVTLEQRLGERVPLDATFRDEAGNTVTLGQYFGSKPVILVLAYYECPMLCTLILNGLAEGLQQVSFEPGSDFHVVVVSINPAETPELAAAKKKVYLEHYAKPGAEAGWHLLVGQEEQIRRVADAVGYRYFYDPKSQQYAHPAGLMMVTPDGRLARYLYGSLFQGRDLKLALMDASNGKIGSPVQQVVWRCYRYDPTTGQYGLAVMTLVRAGGLLTLAALAAFIYLAVRRDRARRARGLA